MRKKRTFEERFELSKHLFAIEFGRAVMAGIANANFRRLSKLNRLMQYYNYSAELTERPGATMKAPYLFEPEKVELKNLGSFSGRYYVASSDGINLRSSSTVRLIKLDDIDL